MQEDTTVFPDQKKLQKEFEEYSAIRSMITRDLECQIEGFLKALPSHPSVKARSKDFPSYFRKYLRILRNELGEGKSSVISDLIGIRIVCPFLEDLALVEHEIKKHYQVCEEEKKGSNQTFKEFGYQSIHLLIQIPPDILTCRGVIDCPVAEIQIRTILQDAWAEVEHELVYKAEFTPLDNTKKRKLAAVNASLVLADDIFQEVRDLQRQLQGEIDKRRESFYQKVEESMDALVFETEKPAVEIPKPYAIAAGICGSVDDFLFRALNAHNQNQFSEAIAYYSRILEMNLDTKINAVVYKHRGMAYFTQSKYQDAINDFTRSLALEPNSYKTTYYRGIIKAVMENYPEAIDDFTQSLAINPYQPYCRYRRGLAYFHLEDFSQALADCEAALALEPSIEPVRKFKAVILHKLKM
ncbi:MAG: tetratricopeptide repeat protein [Treponema sp.]|jgi:putative GTP pyrophosphokinase|nr:tetratricopeptide repeat protein [Treponema sp.]